METQNTNGNFTNKPTTFKGLIAEVNNVDHRVTIEMFCWETFGSVGSEVRPPWICNKDV